MIHEYILRRNWKQWWCSASWFKTNLNRKRTLEDRNISFKHIIFTYVIQTQCKHCTIIIIVMYSGLSWLIIMGSGFGDWVYWHLFTITVNNNSSHIELLLNDVCLTSLSEESLTAVWISGWSLVSRIESESYVTTDGQSASLSCSKAPIWGLRADFHYWETVAVLLMRGALSDERTGLSFIIAADPRQLSHSRVRVPWDSRPYFTVSDLRLLFRRLLILAGIRWRYSTPPPHGIRSLLLEFTTVKTARWPA
jgi:hypothetical protein